MSLTVRLANREDWEPLALLRGEALRAANLLDETADMTPQVRQAQSYFEKHLGCDEHITLLAFDGDELAGCGSLCFYQLMPTMDNPGGLCASVMNMYTLPAHRRKGVGRTVLQQLLALARQRGVGRIQLEATEAGRLLYTQCGFVPAQYEMEYPLRAE